MIDKRISHFRILAQLGEGGMGRVYLAHDERLGRDVALKTLLPGTITDAAARKRFHREARTLSKLNHPHIAAVYDFDTHEGVDFLVMEYVRGTTLAQKIVAGTLPEAELIRLGTEIVSALEEAHENNVVHRDLKPGNIALTVKGQVKVLDFGLARLVQPVGEATTDSWTETQAISGTLPYMAPEQLREGKADSRTDIYAFGVVLYEMTTGQRPFQERLQTALCDAILHTDPAPARQLNPAISPRLEAVISKCMEKDPEHRYQTARDLMADFRRLATGPVRLAPAASRKGRTRRGLAAGALVTALLVAAIGLIAKSSWWATAPALSENSIAVLPCLNIGGDPSEEYLSDGITDDIITQLSKIGSMRVINTASALQYKGTRMSSAEIAAELGVATLLRSSVRLVENQVRISAQLIDPATEAVLWAERYVQELEDLFGVWSDVAVHIASTLDAELSPPERERITQRPKIHPDAYRAYQRGRQLWRRRGAENIEKAIEHFQQAIEFDPTYARAYAGLADAYATLPADSYRLGSIPYEQWLEKGSKMYAQALEAAEHALQLDPTLAGPHATRGLVLRWWNMEEGMRELRLAIADEPNYVWARLWYAQLLAARNQHEDALAQAKIALSLDPREQFVNLVLGRLLARARHYERAIEQLEKTLEMDPSWEPTYLDLTFAYVYVERYEDAIATWRRWQELVGGNAEALVPFFRALAGEVPGQNVLPILAVVEWLYGPYIAARGYAALGETDRALQSLEQAYEMRDPNLPRSVMSAPLLDPIRSEPRFVELLQRLHLDPESVPRTSGTGSP